MKGKIINRKNLIFILFVLLVSSITSNFNSVEAIESHKFSGEEIYAGVAFGQGEVAKLFPEVWSKENLEKLSTKESKRKALKLIAEMKEVDPNYFNHLEKAIYENKDPKEVKELLTRSGKILKKIDPNISENTQVDSAEGACVTFVTWTAVAAIWVAVVAGAVVVASTVTNDKTSLMNEMLVKNMVERLN
ncbi:sporulation delaying protein family toxin [Bacillus subtilis]